MLAGSDVYCSISVYVLLREQSGINYKYECSNVALIEIE